MITHSVSLCLYWVFNICNKCKAETLEDLKVPPENRLEALKGERLGQHSVRINDQFRICFIFKEGDFYDVEITDYH